MNCKFWQEKCFDILKTKQVQSVKVEADWQVVLTLAIFPYSLCPLYFFFAFCDLLMCRGDVLSCKVKNISSSTLNIHFSWQVWSFEQQVNKPSAIEVGIDIRLQNSHTRVSYLCYCRSSHNSPFPGGSYHKPLRFSPSRIRTGPDWTTSSDTGWTWKANRNDCRHQSERLTTGSVKLDNLPFLRRPGRVAPLCETL